MKYSFFVSLMLLRSESISPFLISSVFDFSLLLSTDEKASFYNGDIAALLDRLRNASQFIVRTTPFNEPPCTAIFDVSALRNLDRQFLWLYDRDYKSTSR